MRDAEGHPIVSGRPRKTADELDAEMDDYFASGQAAEDGNTGSAATQAALPAATGGDIEMEIE